MASETDVQDIEYKTRYYAEHREKIRENARRYSAKLRSDPAKRKQINAQKREAMRRLIARRKAEKEQEERPIPVTDSSPEDQPSSQGEDGTAEADHVDIVVLAYDGGEWENEGNTKKNVSTRSSYVHIEDDNIRILELDTEDASTPSSHSVPVTDDVQEPFPFASGVAACLSPEDRKKFISYMEDSAHMYLKHYIDMNQVVDKPKLLELTSEVSESERRL